jgi:ubiquinone/menaquinone biosynthesis C-methylase UbiE
MDPEGIELKTVLQHVSFQGKTVLEIGCGDGRVTFQYAPEAGRVVAIDPDAERIKTAKRNLPKALQGKVEFRVGKGEELPFAPASYDIVFFTWSLCCTAIPQMKTALEAAWRVLKPDGLLVNLQPSLHQPFQRGLITYLINGRFEQLLPDADEENRHARQMLKFTSLVERRFAFLVEEAFTTNTYYDTVDEALEDIVEEQREQYESLDAATKEHIRTALTSTRQGRHVLVQENVVLTVLRKTA